MIANNYYIDLILMLAELSIKSERLLMGKLLEVSTVRHEYIYLLVITRSRGKYSDL